MRSRRSYRIRILLLSLSPIVATLLLLGRTAITPPELAPDPVAEFTTVTSVEVRDEVVINAVVNTADRPKILSAGYSGSSVITAVFLEPGVAVGNGDRLFEIDGSGVILAVTPKPFYRTLGLGFVGNDVTMLQAWLADIEYLDPDAADGRFGRDTKSAVQRFNSDRGVTDPQKQASFVPNSVSWADGDITVIGEVALEVGTAAPPLGAVVALGPPEYEDLVFEVSTGGRARLEGQWKWVVAEEIIGTIVDGEASPEAIAIAVNSAFKLESTGSGASDRSGRLVVPGIARRTASTVRFALPVGSVISIGDETCIFVMNGDDLAPQSVAIVGGEFGSVWIEPSPGSGSRVLANPLTYLSDISCE